MMFPSGRFPASPLAMFGLALLALVMRRGQQAVLARSAEVSEFSQPRASLPSVIDPSLPPPLQYLLGQLPVGISPH